MAKFLTKKVCLIVLAVVIAAGGVIWAIVANMQPKFRSGITNAPAANAINYVSGNGTASVLVDDYLYFVGGSVATSSIKYGDNEYYAKGKMPESGIYRVRIADSTPVVQYEYDNSYKNDAGEKVEWQEGEEGYNQTVTGVLDWDNVMKKKQKDSDGYNKPNYGIDPVVPKIAGHDQTAMWVFGKYLIYTSPHNRYDNRANLLSNYMDFFRVDLDGKNHTLIYTSDSPDLTTDNFTVWANAEDRIYLLIHETKDNEIRRVDVKSKKVTTLDNDVSDVILPSATHYFRNSENETLAKVYGGVMANVYYTKSREDSSMGNVLWRCSIVDGTKKTLASDGTGSTQEGTTFTPLAVTPLEPGDAQFVFRITVKNPSTTKRQRIGVITNKYFTDYQYKEPEDETWGLDLDNPPEVKIYANRFCTVDGDLYRYDINGLNTTFNGKILSSGVDKVLAVFGNTVYAQRNNTVYIVNATTGTQTPISVVPETNSDDEEDTESTENALTLPLAILYQPHGDTGDPMIFAQDATQIRLYTGDGKCSYLKLKES